MVIQVHAHQVVLPNSEVAISLDKICEALSITPVPSLEVRHDCEDSWYFFDDNHILLGLKSHKDVYYQQVTLIHECVHALGILHTGDSHRYGYYSNWVRDTFSGLIHKWIFNGYPKPVGLDKLLSKVKK